ncbi:MAG: hypothetical protein ACR2QV_03360, partial [Gammaproteobacteria bacterium]
MNFLRALFLSLLLISLQINAQDANETGAESPALPAIPDDEFDRGTPLRTAAGFLATADKGDYETAAEYLDLRNLFGEATQLTGAQLARRLDVIAKRAEFADVDELVDDPAGRDSDNLPSYRDSIGVVVHKGKEVRLLMQRVPRGDGVYIWKVSNATVSLIPELYAAYGYPETIEALRRNVPPVVVLGFDLFIWIIVLAVAVLAYVLVYLI